jgi:MoaA/NifB/PqqE/SkfB family radical SAM enzyme
MPLNITTSPARLFAEAKRNDRSKPRMLRCLNPFRWLEVNEGGEVTPCCGPWFKGNLGNLNDQSMEEIWNGKRFRELREAMFKGGDWGRFCNAATCPQIINDTWVPVDFITPDTPDQLPITQKMLDHIRDGKTSMDIGPLQIGLSCDPRCNIRCIMCSAIKNPNRDGALIRKALKGVNHFLPSVKRIKMLGDGEVFVVPEARNFLLNFNSKKYPDTTFLLHTNGLLFTPRIWEKIKHIKIDWIVVSIDAATKKTYEKIRVGGKWDVLVKNLNFLVKKYNEGLIQELIICMTVMKSNHREMTEFAEMGKKLGVASTYFSPVIGDYGEEQIFDHTNISCLKRISRQLKDPVMQDSEIDINAFVEWKNWRPGLKDYIKRLKYVVKRIVKPPWGAG